MADDDISDLYMKFVLNGSPIAGETRSEVQLSKSDMTKDFKAGSMFEITSFTLSTGIGTQDAEDKKRKKEQASIVAGLKSQHDALVASMVSAKHPGPFPKFKPPQTDREMDYSKFRQGAKDAKYPVDMDPIEFTRSLDRASSVLLQNCIKRVNYDSATLIKRRPTGTQSAGEVFLRIDFTKVLMTNIEWSDDQPIKETCKFVCRAVTIHYKPQLPDGSLGAAVPGFWTMSPGLKQVQL